MARKSIKADWKEQRWSFVSQLDLLSLSNVWEQLCVAQEFPIPENVWPFGQTQDFSAHSHHPGCFSVLILLLILAKYIIRTVCTFHYTLALTIQSNSKGFSPHLFRLLCCFSLLWKIVCEDQNNFLLNCCLLNCWNKNTLVRQKAIAVYTDIPPLYTSKALFTLHSRQAQVLQKKQKSFCHY